MSKFSEDLRAVALDGRKDGSVNSDAAYDEAVDRLRGKAQTDQAIGAEVDRAAAEYREFLVEDMTDASSAQALALFIMYPDGDRSRGHRSAADVTALLNNYLSAWKAGFRARLAGRLRADLEDAVTREMTRGR